MPTGHNKIGSRRIARDLFSIALEDRLLWRILVSVVATTDFHSWVDITTGSATSYFRLVAVRQRIHGPTAQIRMAQQAAADRKKRIAAERRKMAKQDSKTIKILEARRIAFLVGGNKEDADRCAESINDLQGRR
jgi:hypothetical protein